MPAEIPYATSKAAVQGMTATLAAAPTRQAVRRRMPLAARWGAPGDVAELVAFLVSDAAGWITGQTIDSDGWGIAAGAERADD